MIQFGIDILLKSHIPIFKGKSIGLITNDVATTNKLELSRTALIRNGINITKLFSPEHGISAKEADGAFVGHSKDKITGLPIFSLYGENLKPTNATLVDIDLLLFDIPDIGSRFYTYLWTLVEVTEVAARLDLPIYILDRPNPLSGNFNSIEGPMLDENNCSSFIGKWSIPIRHCCTIGELISYFNTEKQIQASISIIPCIGWDRNLLQCDQDWTFIPTSPAIQSFSAALLYPGLCFIEATNLSEGRGTNNPFTIVGAPYVTEKNIQLITKNYISTSLDIQPIQFIPIEGKYRNSKCYGVQININNNQFNSVEHGLKLIKLFKDMCGDYFQWNTYPTQANPTGVSHLDKLLGLKSSENLFELPFDIFCNKIKEITSCNNWRQSIDKYLLY